MEPHFSARQGATTLSNIADFFPSSKSTNLAPKHLFSVPQEIQARYCRLGNEVLGHTETGSVSVSSMSASQ
jgi:hypothetical protein